MRDRAAQDDRIEQPSGAEVVDILPAAAQEPEVFAALDLAADEGVLHGPDFL